MRAGARLHVAGVHAVAVQAVEEKHRVHGLVAQRVHDRGQHLRAHAHA